MLNLFRAFLSADRKRRCLAVRFAIRLLRLVCDIEKVELDLYSDRLDEFDSDSQKASRSDYIAAEEGYSECEYILGFLESAIEDLEFAY